MDNNSNTKGHETELNQRVRQGMASHMLVRVLPKEWQEYLYGRQTHVPSLDFFIPREHSRARSPFLIQCLILAFLSALGSGLILAGFIWAAMLWKTNPENILASIVTLIICSIFIYPVFRSIDSMLVSVAIYRKRGRIGLFFCDGYILHRASHFSVTVFPLKSIHRLTIKRLDKHTRLYRAETGLGSIYIAIYRGSSNENQNIRFLNEWCIRSQIALDEIDAEEHPLEQQHLPNKNEELFEFPPPKTEQIQIKRLPKPIRQYLNGQTSIGPRAYFPLRKSLVRHLLFWCLLPMPLIFFLGLLSFAYIFLFQKSAIAFWPSLALGTICAGSGIWGFIAVITNILEELSPIFSNQRYGIFLYEQFIAQRTELRRVMVIPKDTIEQIIIENTVHGWRAFIHVKQSIDSGRVSHLITSENLKGGDRDLFAAYFPVKQV